MIIDIRNHEKKHEFAGNKNRIKQIVESTIRRQEKQTIDIKYGNLVKNYKVNIINSI